MSSTIPSRLDDRVDPAESAGVARSEPGGSAAISPMIVLKTPSGSAVGPGMSPKVPTEDSRAEAPKNSKACVVRSRFWLLVATRWHAWAQRGRAGKRRGHAGSLIWRSAETGSSDASVSSASPRSTSDVAG
jgi:hypothetical protein